MGIQAATARVMARYGIDSRQVMTLLIVYLKQDLRGGKAFAQFGTREYISSNWALLTVVGMHLMLGVFLVLFVFMGADIFLYSMLALTTTMFVVALAILAESGNVMFNESELDVIGHLPITSRTYFMAKTLNLFTFTLLLAASVNLLPAIAGVWAARSNAAFFFAHAVSATLVAMFATALVVVCYGLLMRYVSRERLDNIIAYCQVALALFFMLGYQLIPRLMDLEHINITGQFRWQYLLFPPAWFSGVAMLLMGNIERTSIALAAIGLLVLTVLGAIAMRKVALGYSSFITELAYGSGQSEVASRPREQPGGAPTGGQRREYLRALRSFYLPRPVERAVFDLVGIYLRRNREIKVRLYPSLAYFIFFPVLAVFTEGLPDPFTGSGFTFYSLMSAAIICIIAITAVEALYFSEHYNAAYIFSVTPISNVGEIHSGFRKAIFAYLAAPLFIILAIIYSVLWRSPLHALLVIAPWAIIAPNMLMIPFLLREVLPLSRKYQKGQQSARNISIFILCFAGLAVAAPLQLLSIKGYFPYWLFMTCVAVVSAIVYPLLRLIAREARPLEAGQ